MLALVLEEEEGQVRFMIGATMAELPTSTVNTPTAPSFTMERSAKGRVTRKGEEAGVNKRLPLPPTLRVTTRESIERLGMRS